MEVAYLKECFDYDPSSGDIRWKIRPAKHFSSKRAELIFNAQFAGKPAGTIAKRENENENYYRVTITKDSKRTMHAIHRICFAIYHGEMPEIVDHFDGDTLNNKISNLRPASHSANSRNKRMPRTNKSGVCGVHRKKTGWVVHGAQKNGNAYIGHFLCFFEAVCARKSYENSNGFTLRHGKKTNKLNKE